MVPQDDSHKAPDGGRQPFAGLGFDLAPAMERAEALTLVFAPVLEAGALFISKPSRYFPCGYALQTLFSRETRGR